jgi:hypothetical protein
MDLNRELSKDTLSVFFKKMQENNPLNYIKISLCVYSNIYGGSSVKKMREYVNGIKTLDDALSAAERLVGDSLPSDSIESVVSYFSENVMNGNLLDGYCLWFKKNKSQIYRKNVAEENYDGIYSVLSVGEKRFALSYVSEISSDTSETEMDSIWNGLPQEKKWKALIPLSM